VTVQQTESIVLRHVDYGEADRIVHLLTETNGLVHGFVRGARKMKSRIGGRIDLLNYGTLHYFEKEQDKLSAVSDFDLISTFPLLKKNLESFYRASIMAEFVSLVSTTGITDRQLFKIFLSFLKTMNSEACDSRTLLVLFEMFIIHQQGYSPPFESCFSCHKKSVFPMHWLTATNHLVCPDCHDQIQQHSLIVTAEIKDIFKSMKMPDINSLSRIKWSDDNLEYAERFCFEYLRFYLDFQPRTIKMFNLLPHWCAS